MFKLIFGNPYVLIGLFLAIIASYGAVYWKGYSHCTTTEEATQLAETVKNEQKYERIKDEVVRMPVTDLHREYCQWVRDDKEQCLQANIPIP